VMTTFIAFGVTFEVPVVVVVLVQVGIVNLAKLREWRPYVIVGAFVVAAIFTPPDVISQLMMAIPLCLLFELGLFLARFVRTRAAAPAAAPGDSLASEDTATTAPDWTPMSAEEMDKAIADLGHQKPSDQKPDS